MRYQRVSGVLIPLLSSSSASQKQSQKSYLRGTSIAKIIAKQPQRTRDAIVNKFWMLYTLAVCINVGLHAACYLCAYYLGGVALPAAVRTVQHVCSYERGISKRHYILNYITNMIPLAACASCALSDVHTVGTITAVFCACCIAELIHEITPPVVYAS